jgi:NAD(P)-dependent dehydrogenase (short-subunit alcohol dehydrogenase family)
LKARKFMGNLSGRVIVITGASSGIGAATALALAREQAHVVLAARRADRLEEVATRCREAQKESGGDCLTVICDVAKHEDVDRLVAQTVSKFGRLDVMLANAGFGFLAKITDTTEQQFDEIMATNVKGTWYAMQAAAGVMAKQNPREGSDGRGKCGHIIALSSGAARRGLPLYGVYSMTKAAQLSLAEAMRVEVKSQGIYVSTVHPLTTATDFFDVASSKSRMRSTGLGHAQQVEVVAAKIVKLMKRPRPELWPVVGSRWMVGLGTLWPSLGDWVMARSVYKRTR